MFSFITDFEQGYTQGQWLTSIFISLTIKPGEKCFECQADAKWEMMCYGVWPEEKYTDDDGVTLQNVGVLRLTMATATAFGAEAQLSSGKFLVRETYKRIRYFLRKPVSVEGRKPQSSCKDETFFLV